jgi:hypothetical protein
MNLHDTNRSHIFYSISYQLNNAIDLRLSLSIFSHIYYDRPWGSSLNVASDISNDNALGEGEDNREVLTGLNSLRLTTRARTELNQPEKSDI